MGARTRLSSNGQPKKKEKKKEEEALLAQLVASWISSNAFHSLSFIRSSIHSFIDPLSLSSIQVSLFTVCLHCFKSTNIQLGSEREGILKFRTLGRARMHASEHQGHSLGLTNLFCFIGNE